MPAADKGGCIKEFFIQSIHEGGFPICNKEPWCRDSFQTEELLEFLDNPLIPLLGLAANHFNTCLYCFIFPRNATNIQEWPAIPVCLERAVKDRDIRVCSAPAN